MTVRGKPGKPKGGFPPFPPPLEIALRFPHFHRPRDFRSQDQLIRRSRGNDGPWKAWKTKRRFSTLPTALGNRVAISTFPPPRRLQISRPVNSKEPWK